MFQTHTYHIVGNFNKGFSLAICDKMAKLIFPPNFPHCWLAINFSGTLCVAETVLQACQGKMNLYCRPLWLPYLSRKVYTAHVKWQKLTLEDWTQLVLLPLHINSLSLCILLRLVSCSLSTAVLLITMGSMQLSTLYTSVSHCSARFWWCIIINQWSRREYAWEKPTTANGI